MAHNPVDPNSTYTPNYSIEKPAPGAYPHRWFGVINDNMDVIDAAIASGGAPSLDALFPTVVVTSGTQQAAVNTAYVCDFATVVTVTLPATSSVGKVIELIGKGAGGWILAQQADQYVRIDTESTTVGTGGSIASTARYDCLRVRCITADTEWIATSVIGNLQVI